MAISKWYPNRDVASMQHRVNRLFDDFFRGPAFSKEDELTSSSWVPAVDIFETEKELVLKAELPEMKESDISLNVENNILTLRGERSLEKETREEDYHRIERSYGSFHRSFTLPSTVDREKIRATYQDGVLKISLPKKEELKPKQIKIDVDKA